MNAYLSVIESLAAKAEQAIQRNTEDYELDEVLYCGKCKTPKQTVIKMPGFERKVPCLCACAETGRADEEEKEKARISRERVTSMREE